MIRKIIGAAIGSRLASSPAKGGAIGAAAVTAVPFVISRFSLPAIAVLGAGGYFLKRRIDKKKDSGGAGTSPRADGPENAGAKDAKSASVEAPPPGNVVNGTGVIDAPIAAS
jgi:hypothetical protein